VDPSTSATQTSPPPSAPIPTSLTSGKWCPERHSPIALLILGSAGDGSRADVSVAGSGVEPVIRTGWSFAAGLAAFLWPPSATANIAALSVQSALVAHSAADRVVLYGRDGRLGVNHWFGAAAGGRIAPTHRALVHWKNWPAG